MSAPDLATDRPRARGILTGLAPLGLMLGTLFFAASLTPSLVPRPPLIQGALGGFLFAAGYGLGVLLRAIWHWLELPAAPPAIRRSLRVVAVIGCALAAGLALLWSAGWENRLRALMDMEPIDNAGQITIAATALAVFLVLVLLARLIGLSFRILNRSFHTRLPRRVALLVSVALTALLVWTVANGVLVAQAMRVMDASYKAFDALFEPGSPQPTDPMKTGGPGSLLAWEGLGRAGREFIAAGPDRAKIEAVTGRPALEPLRVYAGLNSAATLEERTRLVLDEMIRIGAFERSTLVLITPTGTGWVDPQGQYALEYLLGGDVASVAVQYSFLASWIALLSDSAYGLETARAVFATVYGYWRSLPPEERPTLYLNGLSLGAYNSDRSHDLFQVIGDPYRGALWSGPPFNSPTWQTATHGRDAGTPAWLPTFQDGRVIRFMGPGGKHNSPADWGRYRVLYLQYASDAIAFFDPASIWRRPDWMTPPMGPDVSPEFRWIPVVTFFQLTFDLMFAVKPPMGHGHVYAFPDYVDAWALLTDAPGWDAAALEALKTNPDARPQ
ncbi:MAG: alpha/beta-hydrolase family protein [Sedimentitalea sp.]|nr:alpha/beta-hydrolase family protein [Sedimentitalea sp.]